MRPILLIDPPEEAIRQIRVNRRGWGVSLVTPDNLVDEVLNAIFPSETTHIASMAGFEPFRDLTYYEIPDPSSVETITLSLKDVEYLQQLNQLPHIGEMSSLTPEKTRKGIVRGLWHQVHPLIFDANMIMRSLFLMEQGTLPIITGARSASFVAEHTGAIIISSYDDLTDSTWIEKLINLCSSTSRPQELTQQKTGL